MSIDATIEAAVRRDRLDVVTALVFVVAVSWAYVLAGAGMGMSAWEITGLSHGALSAHGEPMAVTRPMSAGTMEESTGDDVGMSSMRMSMPASWTPAYATLMFFMWWIMMIAMMLPSASPMILLFATFNRKQREGGAPHVPTALFAFGYLAVWALFSLIAVAMQWGLRQADWLSDMLVLRSEWLAAALLLAAGIYQFTRLKAACLIYCQSPLHFLSTRWRKGLKGAVQMGVAHGAFCLGCCWILMLLLFAGGVMNLYWIGGLALFVLIEKLVPPKHWLSHAAGVVMVAAGLFVLL